MSAGNDEDRTAPAAGSGPGRRTISAGSSTSLEVDASIAEIARRHELNANQLFTWRRQFRRRDRRAEELAPILPVTIASEMAADDSDAGSSGQMEIVYSPRASDPRVVGRRDGGADTGPEGAGASMILSRLVSAYSSPPYRYAAR